MKKTETRRTTPRRAHAARCLTIAWVLGAATGCATSQAHARPDADSTGPLSDAQVTAAVERELMTDSAVPYNQINVKTIKGIVTLTGSVSSLLAREQARKLTETVRGVRAVVNRVELAPGEAIADWQLEQDVEGALFADPATDSYQVEVAVENGAATLTGNVSSFAEKQLAATVAMGVRGLRSVENDLTVSYQTDRRPGDVQSEIEKRLRWDALVDDALIDVTVSEGGKVTLRGTVGSAAEKSQASLDAWVAGVTQVDASGLAVEYWAARPGRRRAPTHPSDEAIESAVRDALLFDPRTSSFTIAVDAVNGSVTLSGIVEDLQAKRSAEQDARNTVGVARVLNYVKVQPAQHGDTDAANRIRNALRRNPYLFHRNITVNVRNGQARLNGEVDDYFEKLEADRVAASTAGVEQVNNQLKVEYDSKPIPYDPHVSYYYPYSFDWYRVHPLRTWKTDAQIKEDIESELFWSPFVNSNEIRVRVDDGVAELRGRVDSYSEMYSAVENALEGGAVRVDNGLAVQP